jgi:hypothetical protein
VSLFDRRVAAAAELMKIGVSNAGVVALLAFDIEVIERQLRLLPKRKCRRPEAFIVEAIRSDYSAPNKHYHAKDEIEPARHPVDEGPERAAGPAPADTQGHGAPGPAGPHPGHLGLEP